jgi:hypothetical protein
LWVAGPYIVQTGNGDYSVQRLIDGHVLIWTEGAITYRLEIDMPLAEAVRMAESLAEFPETQSPAATPTSFHVNLRGRTTLAAAGQRLSFPIRLPTYPADLGPPHEVFVQRTSDDFLILIWLQPDDPTRVRLVLYELGPGVRLTKEDPPVLAETSVNGRRAVWVEGSHDLVVEGQDHAMVRFVDENVLIWTLGQGDEEITYRLEGDLPPDEAIRIAESVQ